MKKIILGVSASIAAYKAYDLTRMFVRAGYTVYNVLTENSLNLVTPLTFETLSGNPVYSEMFPKNRNEMAHITLKDDASLLLVAPATANVIGKFAAGIADDILSTTFLSAKCPVLIAPAMNPNMYSHPAVKRNMDLLKSWGVRFIEPATGTAVCGDEGQGKLADIDAIFKAAVDAVKG